MDAAARETALAASLESCRSDEEKDATQSLNDLAEHVQTSQSAFWHPIASSGCLMLRNVEDNAPWIKYSVNVKADFSLTLHCLKMPVTRLGSNFFVPPLTKSKRAVTDFLENKDLGQQRSFWLTGLE